MTLAFLALQKIQEIRQYSVGWLPVAWYS